MVPTEENVTNSCHEMSIASPIKSLPATPTPRDNGKGEKKKKKKKKVNKKVNKSNSTVQTPAKSPSRATDSDSVAAPAALPASQIRPTSEPRRNVLILSDEYGRNMARHYRDSCQTSELVTSVNKPNAPLTEIIRNFRRTIHELNEGDTLILLAGSAEANINEEIYCGGAQPEFGEPITNLTVPIGRDATFRCIVSNLGNYRVGWVKADTKAIQAIHDHVITHNPRVSVSHSDHSTWFLTIKSVQEEDKGQYMCQINSDPMKSQMGFLEVVIPPDFIPEETSGDTMVPEGGTARVSCRARGTPSPRVLWRREDGSDIVVRDHMGAKSKVLTYHGEVLKLSKISRSEMGTYLCIAGNGVPPSVSKRIHISVHFHPVIQVPNQLVGAPLGTDVTIECYVESSPKSINYWVKDPGELIIPSEHHEMSVRQKSMFEAEMRMTIKGIRKDDLGSYICVAKNSLGDVESKIRLYEIPGNDRHSYEYEEKNSIREPVAGNPPDYYDDTEAARDLPEVKDNRVADRATKWLSSHGKPATGTAHVAFEPSLVCAAGLIFRLLLVK